MEIIHRRACQFVFGDIMLCRTKIKISSHYSELYQISEFLSWSLNEREQSNLEKNFKMALSNFDPKKGSVG